MRSATCSRSARGPQLFSNALPPTVACSALESVRVLRREPELVSRLRALSETFRSRLREIGYAPLDGEAAIIPIIVGETAFAIRMSERLLDEGVFVTGFGFPVVPEGAARIRVQMSAALEDAQIEQALEAFARVGSRARPDRLDGNAVAVRALRVRRGGKLVLDGPHRSTSPRGAVTGLLGPSGCRQDDAHALHRRRPDRRGG